MAYMSIAVFRKKLEKEGAVIIEVENLNDLDKIKNK